MKHLLTAVFLMTLFSSCYIPAQQAFFLSPQLSTTNHYKTIPMHEDSISVATYFSGTITGGGGNFRLRDGVFALQANLHRSQQLNHFQAFYGADFSSGVYDVNAYDFPANHVDGLLINQHAGSKFHAGFGVQAGINYVLPLRNGEWRVLGLEGNLQREHGSYYQFRQLIPVEAVNVIEKNRTLASLGLTSDIIGHFNDGSIIGYKLSFIQSLRKLSGVLDNGGSVSQFPKCTSHTLHITVNKWTGYGQMNFGTEALNLQFGMARRINAKKKH